MQIMKFDYHLSSRDCIIEYLNSEKVRISNDINDMDTDQHNIYEVMYDDLVDEQYYIAMDHNITLHIVQCKLTKLANAYYYKISHK